MYRLIEETVVSSLGELLYKFKLTLVLEIQIGDKRNTPRYNKNIGKICLHLFRYIKSNINIVKLTTV